MLRVVLNSRRVFMPVLGTRRIREAPNSSTPPPISIPPIGNFKSFPSLPMTVLSYSAYSTLYKGVYSLAVVSAADYFTILEPHYTPYVVCGALYGLVLGVTRGMVIGIGSSLVKGRMISSVISATIRETGIDNIRLDNASEAELTAIVEKLYARFPWTYQQSIGATIKRTLAFAFLPNVEQVITGIHTEIQFNKAQQKSAGTVEQLTNGVVNGLVQAQVDKVDILLLVLGWLGILVTSGTIFATEYSAKKSMLWLKSKKDTLVGKKDMILEKKQNTVKTVSEMIPEGYVTEKKEKVQNIISKIPYSKKKKEKPQQDQIQDKEE